MTKEQTVLSLNPDGKTLIDIESVLRANDFKIITVASPVEARFELEMRRCGVFLTSYITPSVIYQDLTSLFRRSCPGGLVIFVSKQPGDDVLDADIILSEREDPRAIVHQIQSKREQSQVKR